MDEIPFETGIPCPANRDNIPQSHWANQAHRKVRRQEEIIWIRQNNFDFVVSLCSSNQNLHNYEEMGVPFHHVPFPAAGDPRREAGKVEAFEKVREAVDAHSPDAIVLARFMQVLPAHLCERWAGRALNIHHSFLPSFVGARPYHQAYARGVKLIGATCHYVTADLDAGPIVEQDVIRVDHGDTAEDMVRRGRDIERLVLSRGLRWHLEDRILVHGNKTVVFR